MTGISEILVLILLITGILILPRMLKPAGERKKAGTPPVSLTKRRRAGIVASILYPIAVALILKPWEGNLVLFLAAGLGPIALIWAITWILAGPKK